MEKMYKSKDRSRSETEKLRELSFREKIEYIWSYYNYYIIGGIIAVIVIVSVTYSCATRKDVVLSVAWSVGFLEQEEIDYLRDMLNERIVDNPSKETSEVSLFLSSGNDPTAEMAYINKLVAMLAAGAIDIFIVDMDTLISHSVSEFIKPMDIIIDIIRASDPDLYEIISNETIITVFGHEEDYQRPELTGIRLTDTPLMKELGYDIVVDTFFCMAISTQNYEKIAETLKLFFGRHANE